MRIALAGNPNAGKSTLFNGLCGTYAHVGNYAGVTVERREAPLQPATAPRGRRAVLRPGAAASAPVAALPTLIDLPGCYSLTARSADEDVAQRVLLGDLGERPCDLVLCVVDALQLARGLYLVLQLRELGLPCVVALNMADVAQKRGLGLCPEALAQALGLPVFALAARSGAGVPALRAGLERLAESFGQGLRGQALLAVLHAEATRTGETPAAVALPQLTAEESQLLAPVLAQLRADGHPAAPRPEGLALWLVTSRLPTLALQLTPALRHRLAEAQAALNAEAPGAFNRRVIGNRFAAVDALIRSFAGAVLPPHPRTRALDDWLLHPLYGTGAFVITMFVLFQAVFAWAEPTMAAAGQMVGALADSLQGLLPAGHLRSLLVDGLLVGVGNVLTFVPQVAFLFFGLGLLEESGYLARAASLMDRLMRRVGLSGRAFIPLMGSFACAIPGILATRTMASRADRLRTMLVAPLMSCSARLPVYALVIAATFSGLPPLAGFINVGGLLIFAMYALGFLLAMATAWLLRRTVVPGPVPALLLELPDYRLPRLGSVLRQTGRHAFAFVRGSGGTIVALSAILWATLHIPSGPTPSAQALAELACRQPAWATRCPVHKGPAPRHAAPAARLGDATSPTPVAWLATLTPPEQQALTRAYRLEHSFAGRVGQTLEPVLRPLGFDWRIGVGLLASFAAREVLVSTLAQIYALSADTPAVPEARALSPEQAGADTLGRPTSLSETLRLQRDAEGRPSFTPLVGLSLMVFFVVALQCSSTVAVLRRETHGWRWPLLALAYMNTLAWAMSFVVYQGGRLLGYR